MAFVDGKFQYNPEINFFSISEQNSAAIIEHLDEFKKGYLRPLEAHILNADGLRQFLNSSSMPPELTTQIRIKLEDLDSEIKAIIRLYSDIEARLDPHEIDNEATHFFHSIFSSEELTESKMNYCRMIKSHEGLKRFNSETLEHWRYIASTLEAIKVVSNIQPFLEQALEFKVYPRIELCEKTELLIRRMEYILRIPFDADLTALNYKNNYSSLLKYNLGTIFQPDLDKYILEETQAPEQEAVPEEDENTCISDPYFLDSRGNSPFNQSYLYTLSIDEKRVLSDAEKIKKAVYLETHLSAEEISLRQDMIRHFVSGAKRKNNLSEYRSFLQNHFDFTYEGLMMHFDHYSALEKNILMYHFGPIFFLKMIMQFMREGRTGYIHRFLGRNNIARELPFEFIKFILKDWWDTNVYKSTTLKDRNNNELYNKIYNDFQDKWATAQRKVLKKITEQSIMVKAYHVRDYKSLRPFLENELSFLFYIVYSRFLGTDFLYLPLNKLPKELVYTGH